MHGGQRPDPDPQAEEMQALLSRVGICSPSYAEAAVHLEQTQKDQRDQKILEARDGRHPGRHLVYPPDSRLALSSPPSSL